MPISYINSSQLSNEKSTEIAFHLSKNLSNNKVNHLTRSFSTRSAFSGTQFQSNKGLKNNRVTICEQITNSTECKNDNNCLKCNSKLNKLEKVGQFKISTQLFS